MKAPIVSIIIPAFNVEKYIRRCIASLQEQSLKDIEIVVVNDCSTDKTLAVIEELQKMDSRIRVFSNEKNMGPMWNRDFGARQARGKYITFCDGDDTMPKEAIEHMYNTIDDQKADMLSGNIKYIYQNGSTKELKNSLPYGNDFISTSKALLHGNLRHELCSKIFKKTLFTDYNYDVRPNFTHNEDEYMLFQIVQNIKKAVVLDEPIYNYYQVMSSSTQNKISNQAIENIFFVQSRKKELFSVHPELKRDVDRSIARYVLILYTTSRHYDSDMLKACQKKYNLENCLSFNVLRHSYSSKEICKIYLKLLLQHKLKLN